jgi:hypothetical protein
MLEMDCLYVNYTMYLERKLCMHDNIIVSISTDVFKYVCMCIYIYIYTYIYIQTHTHTAGQGK